MTLRGAGALPRRASRRASCAGARRSERDRPDRGASRPRGSASLRRTARRSWPLRATASSTCAHRHRLAWQRLRRAGAAAAASQRAGGNRVTSGPADHRWQSGAHALLALARLDTATAPAPPVGSPPHERLREPADADGGRQGTHDGAERAEPRVYAARAAAALGARDVLFRLAGDRDRNVQEAAIAGLAATAATRPTACTSAGCGRPDTRSRSPPPRRSRARPIPRALARAARCVRPAERRRSENARTRASPCSSDRRAGLVGHRAAARPVSRRLRHGRRDARGHDDRQMDRRFDAAAAVPLPIRAGAAGGAVPRPGAPAPRHHGAEQRRRQLYRPALSDETPATVARVTRLVREGFYNGKSFQRVEPNFVIQGGGPDANEYVGDRRSCGTSCSCGRTRAARSASPPAAATPATASGSSTSWTIPLLDHEFTIFGRIDGGQAVAERILEGDRIARMEVLETATGAR